MENTELATITNDAPDMVKGMYCSIHAETQEDRLDIYEAVSNSLSLDDMVGKVVERHYSARGNDRQCDG